MKWILPAALVLALIIVPFAFYGDAVDAWAKGFIDGARADPVTTALVLGGLLAGDIVLPVPSSVVSTACGLLLGLLPGLLVSFAGMTVSSLAGYAIGRWGGRRMLRRLLGENEVARFDDWTRKFGDWTVVACRPVPVLAEASVLIAGAARMSFGRYIAMVSLSNLAVSTVYAVAGALSARINSFLIAFLLSLAVPGVIKLLVGRNKCPGKEVPKETPK